MKQSVGFEGSERRRATSVSDRFFLFCIAWGSSAPPCPSVPLDALDRGPAGSLEAAFQELAGSLRKLDVNLDYAGIGRGPGEREREMICCKRRASEHHTFFEGTLWNLDNRLI